MIGRQAGSLRRTSEVLPPPPEKATAAPAECAPVFGVCGQWPGGVRPQVPGAGGSRAVASRPLCVVNLHRYVEWMLQPGGLLAFPLVPSGGEGRPGRAGRAESAAKHLPRSGRKPPQESRPQVRAWTRQGVESLEELVRCEGPLHHLSVCRLV